MWCLGSKSGRRGFGPSVFSNELLPSVPSVPEVRKRGQGACLNSGWGSRAVPRCGGAEASEGGWVVKRCSAQNAATADEGSGSNATIPPPIFLTPATSPKQKQ